jgi:type II secretory pathway predicted ATPase ExeA
MHPVLRNSYVLPTNALEAFVNMCVMWTRANVLGVLVYGLQRAGKSLAIEYFIANVGEWLGRSVAVVSMEVLTHRQTNEGVFLGDLLNSMGHPTTKRSPEDRRRQFIARLVEAAARSELRKLVVFLDEAQRLDDFMFDLLIGIHNELERLYKVKVLWILVGQPELQSFPSTYIAQAKRQIVARFMTDTYLFQPLMGEEDFRDAITCFDERLRYPNSGPSFTAFFAPGPWAAGWTLASQSGLIWQCLGQARIKAGLSETSGMTMQGFTTLMNFVLTELLPTLGDHDRLTEAAIMDAILKTNCMIFERQEAVLSLPSTGSA